MIIISREKNQSIIIDENIVIKIIEIANGEITVEIEHPEDKIVRECS